MINLLDYGYPDHTFGESLTSHANDCLKVSGELFRWIREARDSGRNIMPIDEMVNLANDLKTRAFGLAERAGLQKFEEYCEKSK